MESTVLSDCGYGTIPVIGPPAQKQDQRLMLRANEDADGVQNFDQQRNATGSMLLSSVGDERFEIGLTFASASFSGPSSLRAAAETESLEAVTLEDAERDHIRKILEQTRWVVAGPKGAAARLGIKRSTLYFRMQKLGISRTNRGPLPA
jgi:transcriptional regulator with GAF, ATPase, and Fis domain